MYITGKFHRICRDLKFKVYKHKIPLRNEIKKKSCTMSSHSVNNVHVDVEEMRCMTRLKSQFSALFRTEIYARLILKSALPPGTVHSIT